MDHSKKLNHISLCTGYGGIDLGLSRALGDVRTIAYVEIEAFAVENLVAKIESELLDVAPVFSDLKRFPWSLYRGKVDLVSGGFPCQPFSTAGRRAGDDDPRHLFPYILDGLRELGKPPLVFLENVEGIISSKLKGDQWSDPEGTPVLLHVLRELERLGYDATAGVFSAREVGAPHQRKRVFILACRSDLGQSGRALVSSMLRDTESGLGLVDPCDNSGRCSRASLYSERGTMAGRQACISIERDAQDTHAQHAGLSMEHATGERLEGRAGASVQGRSARSPRSGTAYPAPRGAEQHPWEPPRVTMGDTKHARPPRAEERRGAEATSDRRRQEAETGAGQPSRAGESASGRYLSSCSEGEHVAEMGDTRSGKQRSFKLKPCLLSKQESEGETGLSQRASHRGREVNTKEAQPSMGRELDGVTNRMGYAELCTSLDNRTDELRLLGNGVVPDTAERAFRQLWRSF